MDALISEFTFLSDEALRDKTFDPAAIEDLMKLYEIEAYRSWAGLELEQVKESEGAKNELWGAEEYLNSVLADAVDECRRFEEEMDAMAMTELMKLEVQGERAWKLGKLLGKAVSLTSKKYIDAAVNAATSSMKSTVKAVSSNKVHPS